MRRNIPILAVLALALPALLACGGDNGAPPEPELGDLEPLVIADSVNALVDPLPGVRTVSQNFRAALADLREGGVAFRRTGTSPASATGSPAAVTFPSDYLGKVFRYEPSEDRWVVDAARTGAPADGVRVLWYELDGSGGVVLPVHEMGHIDLTDGSDPSLEQLRINGVEVRTTEENVDLLDFVQGYATEGGTALFEAEGSYADATRTVAFTADSEQGGGSGQDYVLSTVLQNDAIRYELRAEGMGASPGGGLEDDLRAAIELDGDVTVVELEVTGIGPEQSASGSITHNGTLLATMTADNLLYAFSDPDGNALSATSTSELNAMVRAVLFAGLEPFTWLPFELP